MSEKCSYGLWQIEVVCYYDNGGYNDQKLSFCEGIWRYMIGTHFAHSMPVGPFGWTIVLHVVDN